jgi:hypothetical protein
MFGGIYASIIWVLIRMWGLEIESGIMLAVLSILTGMIVMLVVKFFVVHWKMR